MGGGMGGAGRLPFEGIDQVVQVHLQKVVDNGQGIFVWCRVKIEGAPQKMAGSVRQKELLGGGRVAADVEKDAPHSIWGMDHGLIDGTGLVGMFVGHFECIVGQFVKGIESNLLIADVDPCRKAGKVHVDPIWVFRYGVEKAAVLEHVCVDGVLEAIGIARAVESLVLVAGEIDPKIPAAFGGVGAVTGLEAGEGQQQDVRKE